MDIGSTHPEQLDRAGPGGAGQVGLRTSEQSFICWYRRHVRPSTPGLTVCRGCCCGSGRKHAGVDHAALLDRLSDGVAVHGLVRTSECLGPCAESDVVVVRPAPDARRAGARPVWLRAVLDDRTADAVVTWVREGGPGRAERPSALDGRVFTPDDRSVDT